MIFNKNVITIEKNKFAINSNFYKYENIEQIGQIVNKYKIRKCILILKGLDIHYKIISLPTVSNKKIDELLKINFNEYFPYEINDVIYDFRSCGFNNKLVACCKMEVIQPFLNQLQNISVSQIKAFESILMLYFEKKYKGNYAVYHQSLDKSWTFSYLNGILESIHSFKSVNEGNLKRELDKTFITYSDENVIKKAILTKHDSLVENHLLSLNVETIIDDNFKD